MSVDRNRMFQCFKVAAVWEGWSEAEQAEIGAAIKAALEAGDDEIVSWWAEYLESASGLAHLTALCRAAEARIKAEMAAKRQGRAA